MTITKFAAGAAGALFVVFTGSAALAADYVCQTWSPAKASPPTTHCITWAREASARMRAAPCDPSKMTLAAMQAQCEALMASPAPSASAPAAR